MKSAPKPEKKPVSNATLAEDLSPQEIALLQEQQILQQFPMIRVVSKARGIKPDSAFGTELEAELNHYALQGYACLHAFMPDSRTFHAVLLNTISPQQRLAALQGANGAAEDQPSA